MSTFLQSYMARDAQLMAFYAKSPEALFNNDSARPVWNPALLEALRSYQGYLGLDRKITGNEWVIVTGQQPGMFTGPLYTIYKAISAIRLAQECELRTGIPHLPVYWVASDDHDFEEVRSSHFLTRNHTVFTHRYEIAEDGFGAFSGLPMFRMPLESSLKEVVDQISRVVRFSDVGEEIRDLLLDTLNDAASLSDWHARLMAVLFRNTPLCIFSPHLDAARECAKPVIAHDIATPLKSTELLNETGQALKALGYDAQVVKAEHECNFFLYMGGRRRKVLFRDGYYYIPEEQLRCTPVELEHMLNSLPEQFSPNVALRCIVQQALFPTRCYVAGPGELAYWAQLKPLFEHYKYSMPIVYPRARALLLPQSVARLQTDYALQDADFTRPHTELEAQALTSMPTLASLEHFYRHETSLRAQVGSLREALQQMSPTQERAQQQVRLFHKAFEYHLEKLKRGLLRGDIERNRTVCTHVTRMCNVIAPLGKPQERVLNIFSFLFEHGIDLIPHLIATINPVSNETQEIIL